MANLLNVSPFQRSLIITLLETEIRAIKKEQNRGTVSQVDLNLLPEYEKLLKQLYNG